jgi:t-SNARE complex subunit (syntaxin)
MAKFFHLQKNKRFTYKPRYYDERAERRKEHEAAILKEIEAEKAGKKVRLTKDDMENYIKIARRTQKKSNTRILVIIIILMLLFYFFFYKT